MEEIPKEKLKQGKYLGNNVRLPGKWKMEKEGRGYTTDSEQIF